MGVEWVWVNNLTRSRNTPMFRTKSLKNSLIRLNCWEGILPDRSSIITISCSPSHSAITWQHSDVTLMTRDSPEGRKMTGAYGARSWGLIRCLDIRSGKRWGGRYKFRSWDKDWKRTRSRLQKIRVQYALVQNTLKRWLEGGRNGVLRGTGKGTRGN